jgi:hypothetical protein
MFYHEMVHLEGEMNYFDDNSVKKIWCFKKNNFIKKIGNTLKSY